MPSAVMLEGCDQAGKVAEIMQARELQVPFTLADDSQSTNIEPALED